MEKAEFFSHVMDGGDVRCDVIVATGSNEISDVCEAGYFDRKDRAKVVLQLHLAPRGFFKWRHPLRNWRIRKAFNRADAVQVLCRSYESEFRRIAPAPRVYVIGNYTDMPEEVPCRDAGQGRSGRPVILYPAAVLNKVKNQRLLIEAFALLASDFPEWKVRLLGRDETPYAKMCRRLIAAKRLDGRIEVAGFTDRLKEEYASAAFIAFPSTLEGFPLAILEAARFSLAAVAQSGLPGIGDIVTEDSGIVTDPNAAAYAAGLRRLMEDDSLRRKLGDGARVHCGNRYGRDKILDQWEMLLENVVK